MANGLFAALSPNEATTLRSIAHRDVHSGNFREGDVARLKHLGLVEETRTGLALSLLGHQRLTGTIRSSAKHDKQSSPD